MPYKLPRGPEPGVTLPDEKIALTLIKNIWLSVDLLKSQDLNEPATARALKALREDANFRCVLGLDRPIQ